MMARVLTRTHYQVSEPAYLETLVTRCSSATKSDYADRVARNLEKTLKSLSTELNFAAAKYCVDLAKGLGLLTENNFWNDLGHVLNLIALDSDPEGSERLRLDLRNEEKVFFFRLFLEYDGAALIFIAKSIAHDGLMPTPGKDWNSIANDMMEFIYRSYLEQMTDFRERARLRQLLSKRTSRPYTGKSGAHQCIVHLQTLMRIGLLELRDSAARREYVSGKNPPGQKGPLNRFLEAVPSIAALEDVVARRDWPKVAHQIYGSHVSEGLTSAWTDREVLSDLRHLYERVMATGVRRCSLRTLIETVQVKQIAGGVAPISYDDCLNLLRIAQAESPRQVRFHVDRLGRPAFVSF